MSEIMINETSSCITDVSSKLDEHIKQFNKLSEMYINYASDNTKAVDQLEENLIKYASALAKNLVEVRSLIDSLKQADNDIQEQLDLNFPMLDDRIDAIKSQIEDLKVKTIKRDDYPGSQNANRTYRSKIRIGNVVIPCEKKFSKFGIWLWNKLLRIEITNLDVITVHRGAIIEYRRNI